MSSTRRNRITKAIGIAETVSFFIFCAFVQAVNVFDPHFTTVSLLTLFQIGSAAAAGTFCGFALLMTLEYHKPDADKWGLAGLTAVALFGGLICALGIVGASIEQVFRGDYLIGGVGFAWLVGHALVVLSGPLRAAFGKVPFRPPGYL